MASSRRTNRYSHEIHHWLSSKFLTDIADPMLQGLRVLEVDVSPDLRLTKVYYVLAKGNLGKPSELQKAIKRVTPYLKRSMGSELELRYVPELKFIEDESFEERQRLAVALEAGKTPGALYGEVQ